MPNHQQGDKEKDKDKWKKFGEHGLTLSGFLGGITLSSMVLIMQSKEEFEFEPVSSLFYYPELLIIGLAAVVILFIISAAGLVLVASGERKPLYTQTIQKFMSAGLYAVCGFVPLILLPFSLVGAIVITVIVIMCFIMLSKNV